MNCFEWNESELKTLDELLTPEEKEFLDNDVAQTRAAQKQEAHRPTYHFQRHMADSMTPTDFAIGRAIGICSTRTIRARLGCGDTR